MPVPPASQSEAPYDIEILGGKTNGGVWEPMRKHIWIIFLFVGMGCVRAQMSEGDARALALGKVQDYCKRKVDACDGLSETGARRVSQGCFFEFKTKDYLYSAVVGSDGSVELGRMSEEDQVPVEGRHADQDPLRGEVDGEQRRDPSYDLKVPGSNLVRYSGLLTSINKVGASWCAPDHVVRACNVSGCSAYSSPPYTQVFQDLGDLARQRRSLPAWKLRRTNLGSPFLAE